MQGLGCKIKCMLVRQLSLKCLRTLCYLLLYHVSADLWRSQRSPLHKDPAQFRPVKLPRITRYNVQLLHQTFNDFMFVRELFHFAVGSYCLCGQAIGLPAKYVCNSNRVSKKAKTCEVIRVHAIKVYDANWGRAPLILNFSTRWSECLASRSDRFAPSPPGGGGKNWQCPLNRRMGGPWSWPGLSEQRRMYCSCRESNRASRVITR
jgi:hypothetical protein